MTLTFADDFKLPNVSAESTSSPGDLNFLARELRLWLLLAAALDVGLPLTTPELYQWRCLAAARSLSLFIGPRRILCLPWLVEFSPSRLPLLLIRHRHASSYPWLHNSHSLAPLTSRRQ